MRTSLSGADNFINSSTKEPEIAEQHPDMNFKVAAFTVSEKSNFTHA